MAQPRDGARRQRLYALFRWHRWTGVSAAAVLLFLLITGVPLQFSGALDLGNRHVQADWVLDWYGLQAPAVVRTSGSAAGVGEQLFIDGEPVATLAGFHGAVQQSGLVAAAGDHEVLLFDPATGTELDRFHFPGPVTRIGRYQQSVALETDGRVRLADADLVNWTATTLDAAQVDWHPATTAEPAEAAALRRRYRHGMLSMERLLQDLHSGRAFGNPGVVAIDLASLLLGFLAVSGLIMWWRTPAR